MSRVFSLFNDYLTALGVPHTDSYSGHRFESMPFPTLFGLSELLEEYGVKGTGLRLSDKTQYDKVPLPFLAQTRRGVVVVTSVGPETVDYVSYGTAEKIPVADFRDATTGVVWFATDKAGAKEPKYRRHRLLNFINGGKIWVLLACAAFIFAYLFITGGLYSHVSTVLLTLFNCAGLYFSYLLVQKSVGVKNKHADAVCGILQAGGCDDILSLKASTFFGIFSWSEVGLTYFSVSLLTLLIFPQFTQYLALCNICCLPFTLWSIWYQKFRARKWCTLCVSVQATLWCLFFCYLIGGFVARIAPVRIQFFILGATYVTVLLALNRITPLLKRSLNPDNYDL